jgi:hypothetical protein
MCKSIPPAKDGASLFVAQHSEKVSGVLRGFDRILITGTLRQLHYNPMGYLSRANVLLKDFGAYACGWKERICSAAKALAERSNRPLTYLWSSDVRKEHLARDLAVRDGIENGLIGIWSALERCQTFNVHGNRRAKKLQLSLGPGKCLHYYFYFMHEQLGLMHLRLQTWFPFAISICLNGRHWLARMMDKEKVGYLKEENCFTELDDLKRAQQLADSQSRINWNTTLNPLVEQCHPHAREIIGRSGMGYYWSIRESEYATDIMFKEPGQLAELYPELIQHGITHVGSADVLRFLGAKVYPDDRMPANLSAEVLSSFKRRPEGMRVKHQYAGNSVKIYDKHGRILRTETTINTPGQFKVYRKSEQDPKGPRKWRKLRRGVADMKRREDICRGVNGRYLKTLAGVRIKQRAGKVAGPICRPVIKNGRRYRAIRPWSKEDQTLLRLINNGQWMLAGFRNRDLREALHPGKTSPQEQRRQSGQITRALARLKAHQLIKKVSKSYRYQVTDKGRDIITALLAAQQADVDQLVKMAA